MIDKNKKSELIAEFKTSANDTGSAEVQVALLSARINELTGHLKGHAKDFSSKRGLLKMVGERKSLLKYIEARDKAKHKHLLERFGIRG